MDQSGMVAHVAKRRRVCGAMNENCIDSSRSYIFDLSFRNNVTNEIEIMTIKAFVIPTTFPIIIGLPTIQKNSLTTKLRNVFEAGHEPHDVSDRRGRDSLAVFHCSRHWSPSTGLQRARTSQARGLSDITGETNFPWEDLLITASLVKDTAHEAAVAHEAGTAQEAATMHATPHQGVGHCNCTETIQCGLCADVSDDDEFDDEYNRLFDRLCSITNTSVDDLSPDEEGTVIPTNIEGTPSLQAQLINICHQHEAIFSRSIKSTPAKLPPFELKLKPDEKWTTSRSNHGRPRQLPRSKQDALREQVYNLVALGALRESQAAHYSQAHMVPKKPDKWRFTNDYRELNDECESMRWPIPNIKEMFDRIGAKRPKYFAKIDLTSGYHQIEVAEKCRWMTAFITPFGLYEWCRLPMGPKGACSYFQQMMQTVLSLSLIHI